MIEDVLNKEEAVVTPEIVKKKKKASVPDIKVSNCWLLFNFWII